MGCSIASWPVYSPFAREHYGRGKDEGLAEGRAEGRAEGEAQAILRVLAARRIEVPEEARVRIRECTDQRQFDTWLDRALVATAVTDLFD
jgi:predicted transposase YdaD